MNPDIEALKQFKARMDALALKNDDAFTTTVTFDEKGYHVKVAEIADSHVFISGSGPTVVNAIEATLVRLPVALKSWGYQDT